MTRKCPLGLSYWVEEPWLLAGPFPGHADPQVAERQLRGLLDAGIRGVVDLMEEDPRGAPPYGPQLARLAAERGLHVPRWIFPIEDHDVPSPAAMRALEARLARARRDGRPLYVHCWGGRGRTGIVAAVALVRAGLARPDDVLEVLAARRTGLPGESPERAEQVEFVRRWTRGPQGAHDSQAIDPST